MLHLANALSHVRPTACKVLNTQGHEAEAIVNQMHAGPRLRQMLAHFTKTEGCKDNAMFGRGNQRLYSLSGESETAGRKDRASKERGNTEQIIFCKRHLVL